jgi:hypothetical protein
MGTKATKISKYGNKIQESREKEKNPGTKSRNANFKNPGKKSENKITEI